MSKKIVLMSLLGLMASQAYADSGLYVGGDMGGSETYYHGYGRGGMLAAGLFSGYNFTQNIGLELGYTSYPDAIGNQSGYISQQGVDLVSVWSMHLIDHFSGYGKFGLSYINASAEQPGLGSDTANVWNLGWGFGIAYDIDTHLVTRVEWFRAQGASDAFQTGQRMPDSDLYTLGLLYRF